MGLFRTIFIIALVYFGIKILVRLFMPLLAKNVVKNAEKKFGTSFNDRYKTNTQGKKGETVIDRMPPKQNQSNKKVGEYVDFEEIE